MRRKPNKKPNPTKTKDTPEEPKTKPKRDKSSFAKYKSRRANRNRSKRGKSKRSRRNPKSQKEMSLDKISHVSASKPQIPTINLPVDECSSDEQDSSLLPSTSCAPGEISKEKVKGSAVSLPGFLKNSLKGFFAAKNKKSKWLDTIARLPKGSEADVVTQEGEEEAIKSQIKPSHLAAQQMSAKKSTERPDTTYSVLNKMPSNRPLNFLIKGYGRRVSAADVEVTQVYESRLPANVSLPKARWLGALKKIKEQKQGRQYPKLRQILLKPHSARDSMKRLTTKDWKEIVKDRQQTILTQRSRGSLCVEVEDGLHPPRTISRFDNKPAEPTGQTDASMPAPQKRGFSIVAAHVFGGRLYRPVDNGMMMSSAEAECLKQGTANPAMMTSGNTFSERVGQYMNACRRGTIYVPISTLETEERKSLSGSEGEDLDCLEKKLDEMDENEIEDLRHKFKVMPTNMKCKKEYRRRLLAYEDMHGLGIMNDKNLYRNLKEELALKYASISFQMWQKSFILIESHFGTSAVAYFYFLRWLLYLNICIASLQICFTLIPQLAYSDRAMNFSEYLEDVGLQNESYAHKAVSSTK